MLCSEDEGSYFVVRVSIDYAQVSFLKTEGVTTCFPDAAREKAAEKNDEFTQNVELRSLQRWSSRTAREFAHVHVIAPDHVK